MARGSHSPSSAGPGPMSGLRVRLMGLPEEVAAGAEVLAEVSEASEAYPCRGASANVRAYLQVRFKSSQT